MIKLCWRAWWNMKCWIYFDKFPFEFFIFPANFPLPLAKQFHELFADVLAGDGSGWITNWVEDPADMRVICFFLFVCSFVIQIHYILGQIICSFHPHHRRFVINIIINISGRPKVICFEINNYNFAYDSAA